MILLSILAVVHIVCLVADGVFDKAYYEVRYFLTKEKSQEEFREIVKEMDAYYKTGAAETISNIEGYNMGDDRVYIEPRPLDEENYGVTVHREDGEGYIECIEFKVPMEGQSIVAPPEVEIFCNYQLVENYGWRKQSGQFSFGRSFFH